MNEVDKYIAKFPEETQQLLKQMREIITSVAPNAAEGMAYGMPGYKLNKKPLVYFAGYKKHIGFYATPSEHEAFTQELSVFKQGKGSVQFPIDQPLPIDLVKCIVRFRVEEINLNGSKI